MSTSRASEPTVDTTNVRRSSGADTKDPVAPGGDSSTPVGTGIPALRRDAARNRDKILASARAAFDEEGVDVGVDVIARRAGVGVGTLYRRFPTKELLIQAVVDEVLGAVLAAARSALENESPANGFAGYLGAVGRLQFEHAGCLTRLWNNTPGDVRDQIEETGRSLLSRAQSAGAVRQDLVYEDVIVLFWSLRGVIEATSAVSPDAWLRHLDLLLSALAPADRPLQHPPLTGEQVRLAKAAVALKESLGAERPGPD
jgi:AcrR family transcriptional regulator